MSAEQLAMQGFSDSSPLQVQEVMALQSLLMGDIRREAVQKGRRLRISNNPRTLGYCILFNSGNDILNGETDTLFSVRVQKRGNRRNPLWRMGVSFLEYEQSTAGYHDNSRTVYQFQWDNEFALGRRREYEAIGKVKHFPQMPDGRPILPGTDTVNTAKVVPLDPAELDGIADRALEVAYSASPRMHQLIDHLVAERVPIAA